MPKFIGINDPLVTNITLVNYVFVIIKAVVYVMFV